jgi:DNA-binding transcriptional LysR family regulator
MIGFQWIDYFGAIEMLDIRSKDLNLLSIFDVLMRERNVSRAAKKLHLSQSTLSYSLSRLREMFGDDLFVRTGRGITPTPRAMEIAPRITQFLDFASSLFLADDDFDAAKAQGTIRIASTEMIEHLLLPKLIPLLRREAPGLLLQSTSTQGFLPKTALERGELDLAIAGFFGDLPEGFYRQELFTDRFRVIARKGHPIFKRKPTIEDYVAWDHILISPQGDMKSLIDKSLGKKSRRLVAGISNFLTPGWVVADSDVLLTAPSRLVGIFEKSLPVRAFDLPFKSPEISVVQVWHERLHRNSLHKWFRGLLRQVPSRPPATD